MRSMPGNLHIGDPAAPAADVHLLGQIDFDLALALQHRIVFEATGQSMPRTTLLMSEHPPIVTMGRRGSWSHVRLDRDGLALRQWEVRLVNHGGGCMLHVPGQLAVSVLVPLEALGFSLGEYLKRLQSGLTAALHELGFVTHGRPGAFGLWGRTGQLAALAVAVRHGWTFHGAVVNVNPPLDLFRSIQTDPEQGTAMSSLAAEHHRPVRVSGFREALARHLTAELGCPRFHWHSGHVLLRRLTTPHRGVSTRAG
jgi:lipoyl(octanoyl) transferase